MPASCAEAGSCAAAREPGSLKHVEDALCGGDARHAGVEARAQLPQRQVELGREDEDEEGRLERQAAREQAQADLDRDDGGAERADHLQHERGQERHPQHLQRRVPVLLADAADQHDLLAAAVEQLQGGQPLQHVEEVRGEPAERRPLPARERIGQAADQRHEDGDQRRGQQEHQARERVDREDERTGT